MLETDVQRSILELERSTEVMESACKFTRFPLSAVPDALKVLTVEVEPKKLFGTVPVIEGMDDTSRSVTKPKALSGMLNAVKSFAVAMRLRLRLGIEAVGMAKVPTSRFRGMTRLSRTRFGEDVRFERFGVPIKLFRPKFRVHTRRLVSAWLGNDPMRPVLTRERVRSMMGEPEDEIVGTKASCAKLPPKLLLSKVRFKKVDVEGNP